MRHANALYGVRSWLCVDMQDKLKQKEHLDLHGIPVARFMSVEDERTEQIAVEALGLPLMLKSRRCSFWSASGDLTAACLALTDCSSLHQSLQRFLRAAFAHAEQSPLACLMAAVAIWIS